MKKIIALALCLVMSCLVLTGCADESEPFTEKSYTPDTQINAVSLDVRDREIEVTPSADGQVHIQYFENSKEYYTISVSADNVLTMTSASGKEWKDYVGTKPAGESRKISLQIPDELLNSLGLATTNEDISLAPLTVAGSVNITANGGDISFAALDVGTVLTVNVKNGDIEGTLVESYDDFAISSKVKKGESNLPNKTGGEKTLNVSANNGDIDIEFVKAPSHS